MSNFLNEQAKHLSEDSSKSYSDKWQISSENYLKIGLYDWCLSKITTGLSIIEIGSGVGISTQKLIEKGCSVTTIEENKDNFTKTINRLTVLDIPFKSISIAEKKDEKFEKNNIVLTNFITDRNLHSDIISKLRFNGIICWFMGVHPLAHFNKELQKIGYIDREPTFYRELIYDVILNETVKYLPKNGIINLIERTALFDNSDQREKYINDFSLDYNLTEKGLVISEADQFETHNPSNIDGIAMETYFGNKKIEGFNKKSALFSITITKNGD